MIHSFFRWLSFCFQEDAPQRFLWSPVGLGIGIALYFYWPHEPSFLLSLMSLGGAVVLLAIYFRHPRYKYLVWPLLIVQVGFCLMGARVQYLNTQMLDHPLKKIRAVGEVEQIDVKEGRKRLILKNFRSPEGEPYLSSMVRLSIRGGHTVHLGDTIYLTATLMPLSAPLLPEGYDYRRASFFQGIGATGWIDEIESIEPVELNSFWLGLQQIRQTINEQLLRLVPGESSAIAAALITGERGYIRDDIRQAYTDAGIAHVLAISGLHLSLIAGIVFMVIRRGLSLSVWMAERFDLKKIASLFTIPFLLGYLFISGMGVPAIRSFIMVSVGMLAILLDRRALSMRLLVVAALIILTFQPESILSASFALSFAAVMGLVALYQDGWVPFQQWVLEGGWARRCLAYLGGIIITTIVASAVTTPISMYIFNRVSVQAILGNLVAIPLTGFVIMPALLLLILSLPFGGSSFCGYVASYGIHLLTKASVYTASLPGAGILVHQPPSLFLWLFSLGSLWLLLWRQSWRYVGGVLILGSFATLFIPSSPMILVDSKGYLVWYDGKSLYHFSDHHNLFTQDVVKRRFGCDTIHDVQEDYACLTWGDKRVAFYNPSSRAEQSASFIKHLSENHDLLITSRPLKKEFPQELADVIVIKRGRSQKARGMNSFYVSLSSPKKPYLLINGAEFQGERAWQYKG